MILIMDLRINMRDVPWRDSRALAVRALDRGEGEENAERGSLVRETDRQ